MGRARFGPPCGRMPADRHGQMGHGTRLHPCRSSRFAGTWSRRSDCGRTPGSFRAQAGRARPRPLPSREGPPQPSRLPTSGVGGVHSISPTSRAGPVGSITGCAGNTCKPTSTSSSSASTDAERGTPPSAPCSPSTSAPNLSPTTCWLRRNKVHKRYRENENAGTVAIASATDKASLAINSLPFSPNRSNALRPPRNYLRRGFPWRPIRPCTSLREL